VIRSKTPVLALALAASLAAPDAAVAQDARWPQWRGPRRDGISRETGWSMPAEGKPVWAADVGLGYSTVSIAGGRLYTLGHDAEAGEDTIVCLDAKTGERRWAHTFSAERMNKYHGGGSLTTPSIDGDRLFVSHREGRFFCLDAKTGKVRWEKNVMEDFDGVMPEWGLAASPLVLEEAVVLASGPILAFDREGDGKLIWKTRSYGHCYATPVDFRHEDEDYLACFTGDGLVVLERDTGREVARSEWETRYDVNAATPVIAGNRIFISSGYNKGCAMLEFDGSSLKELWSSRAMRNHMAGCVLHDDHLYGMDESSLKCLDLDGEEKWGERGFGKGALLLADGKLLALTTRGELVCAEATPEGFRELGRVAIEGLREGRKWTTPVLCEGLLYLRNSLGRLVCIDLEEG